MAANCRNPFGPKPAGALMRTVPRRGFDLRTCRLTLGLRVRRKFFTRIETGLRRRFGLSLRRRARLRFFGFLAARFFRQYAAKPAGILPLEFRLRFFVLRFF